jgi:archaea-specific DNA-binding protein
MTTESIVDNTVNPMSEKMEHKPATHERREPMHERREERPERPRGQIPPDTVFIGKKPLMAYATAVMMHFNSGQSQLTVKARGQSISHAVDVVEVVRRRFFAGKLTIKEVRIASEVLGEEGDTRNVSTIEIVLEKAKD